MKTYSEDILLEVYKMVEDLVSEEKNIDIEDIDYLLLEFYNSQVDSKDDTNQYLPDFQYIYDYAITKLEENKINIIYKDVDEEEIKQLSSNKNYDDYYQLYYQQLHDSPIFNKEKERVYLNIVHDYHMLKNPTDYDQSSYEYARDRLIEGNQRLVYSIARKYNYENCQFLDLVQEGNIGLLKAIEAFDPSTGHRLSTYATFTIRKAITESIANFNNPIKLPKYVCEAISIINKAKASLAIELEKDPSKVTTLEVAQYLNDRYTEDQINLYLKFSNIASADNAIGDESDGMTLLDTVSDDCYNDAGCISKLSQCDFINPDTHEILISKLSYLTDREKEVINYSFNQSLDSSEIAQIMNVTSGRVNDLYRKAIRKIRYYMDKAAN